MSFHVVVLWRQQADGVLSCCPTLANSSAYLTIICWFSFDIPPPHTHTPNTRVPNIPFPPIISFCVRVLLAAKRKYSTHGLLHVRRRERLVLSGMQDASAGDEKVGSLESAAGFDRAPQEIRRERKDFFSCDVPPERIGSVGGGQISTGELFEERYGMSI